MDRISESLIEQLDLLTRTGEGNRVQKALRALAPHQVNRSHRARLAQIARRAGIPHLGVALLHPIVRPSPQRHPSPATPLEKVEYAAALIRMGSTSEGLRLLREVDPEQAPQSRLYEAFAHFGRWNYPAAVPLLERYVRSPGTTDYERLVGEVNLAAALVYEEHPEADRLINRLLTATRPHRLLHGNVLEIAAQRAIEHRALRRARQMLTRSLRCLAHSGGTDALFAMKWEAMLQCLESPARSQQRRILAHARDRAKRQSHGETLRDLDLFWAKLTGRRPDAVHVYAGTPYPSFRERVLAGVPSLRPLPEEYAWRVGPGAKSSHWIRLATGETSASGVQWRPGRLTHRLLGALSADFYQPARVTSLFEALYPEEHYNPLHSRLRVHQAMRRLRDELAQSGLGLRVCESDGLYSLSGERVQILVPVHPTTLLGSAEEGVDWEFAQLRSHLGARTTFGVRDACEAWKIHERSAQRVLKRLTDQGSLIREGAGPRTRYRIGVSQR